MTKAQHCWADWYSPGYGWVVVDPADVRKAILEKKIPLEQSKPIREYYFGAVDESRIAIGTGRDLVLNPSQSGEPLNYFMEPVCGGGWKTAQRGSLRVQPGVQDHVPGIVTGLPGIVPFETKNNVTVGPGPHRIRPTQNPGGTSA